MPAKATFIDACGISLFTISILFSYSLDNNVSYTDSIVAYCFATITTFLIGITFVLRYTFTREKPTFENTNDLFKVSHPIMWYTGLRFIINWSPIFFLSYFYTSTEVGLYSVAFRTAMLITFLLLVIDSISATNIATLYKNEELKKLQVYTKTVSVNTTRFALPLVFVFVLWPEKILLLFGPEFIDAKYMLMIIVGGQFIHVLTGSVDNLLLMTGHQRELQNSMVVVTIITIILNLILVRYYGTIGAALTTAICISMRNLIAAWLVYYHLQIRIVPSLHELFIIKK